MLLAGGAAIGDEPSSENGLINIETKTFGGSQLWTDELIHLGWRVQRHVLTGHYRLLDDQNVRKAFGSYEHCSEAFDRLRREFSIPDMEGRVVIALHGIGRTRQSMQGVCDYLAERGGYQTLNMTYASTRQEIGAHARALAKVVEGLGPEVTEINFVTHSMGGLIVRHYLGDTIDPSISSEPDDRVHRLVMIGPPNHCPNMAKQADRLSAFKLIWGPSGQQMANWETIAPRLAVPTCEFGIIAGGNEQETGHNPLLEGNDDLVVSVEETRLVGAHDFIVLPFIHSFFHKPEVYDKLHCFLQNGYFVSEKKRQPLLE